MTNTQAGWPQGWPWDSKEAPVAGQQPIMWSVDNWKYGKIPSYVQSDWAPYLLNGYPLIIKNIRDNIAEISIQNWKREIVNLSILWENNKPKIFTNSNNTRSFLYIVKEDGQVFLSDPYWELNSPEFPYPLIIIEHPRLIYPHIVIDSNYDWFYRCYCPETARTVMIYQKWEEFIPLEFEGLNDNNKEDAIFKNLQKMPTKDEMLLVWDKLMIWNEHQLRFEILIMGWIVFEWVKAIHNGNYQIRTWGEVIEFSPMLENRREPAWKIINWRFLLATYERCQNEKMAEIVLIDSRRCLLNPKSLFAIWWVQYYEVYDLRENRYVSKWKLVDGYKKLFTDGQKCYDFLTNEHWTVQKCQYNKLECPILDDKKARSHYGYDKYYDKSNKLTAVLLNEDWIQKVVYLIKKEEEINSEEKTPKAKMVYIRLKFTPEQEKMPIIFIDADNWIVCLWTDWSSNTSRYAFYRINYDGTLIFSYKNNYNFQMSCSQIRLHGITHGKNIRYDYTLVRRPNTTSIFEPILINGKSYVVAGWENPWEYVYLSTPGISKLLWNWDEMDICSDYETNPKTFLPNNSFQFWIETFYLTKNWEIRIWDKLYSLVNEKWEIEKDYKKAEFKKWDSSFLLLRNITDYESKDEIFWYIPWSISKWEPKFLSLSNLEMSNPENIENYNSIKMAQLGDLSWTDLICRSIYPEWNILWMYILVSWDWTLKELFLNQVESSWEWEKLIWEEFMYGSAMIDISEIISEKYLKDRNGNLYYRPNLDKHLVKITLPEGINIETKYDDDNVRTTWFFTKSWTPLLAQDWLLMKAMSEWYDDYYRLKDWKQECKMNWKKYSLIQAWDNKNKRLVSFIKKWEHYELFKIWYYTVYVDVEDKRFNLCIGTNSRPGMVIESNPNGLPNLEIVEIRGVIREIGTIEKTTKDKKWWMVYGHMDREFIACALYKSGKDIIAIKLEDNWYKAKIDHSWILSIGWIIYNEAFLNNLYEALRPKTEPQVDKLTKTVSDQVWDIHNKGEW